MPGGLGPGEGWPITTAKLSRRTRLTVPRLLLLLNLISCVMRKRKSPAVSVGAQHSLEKIARATQHQLSLPTGDGLLLKRGLWLPSSYPGDKG